MIEPQSNWASVIIIAAIGFLNYILMKTLGPRGMEITAFFGGLVNSRKVVVELSGRLRDTGEVLLPSVYRGIMLSTLTSILTNVPLIMGLTKDRAFKRRIGLALGGVAATGLVGLLINVAVFHYTVGLPK